MRYTRYTDVHSLEDQQILLHSAICAIEAQFLSIEHSLKKAGEEEIKIQRKQQEASDSHLRASQRILDNWLSDIKKDITNLELQLEKTDALFFGMRSINASVLAGNDLHKELAILFKNNPKIAAEIHAFLSAGKHRNKMIAFLSKIAAGIKRAI